LILNQFCAVGLDQPDSTPAGDEYPFALALLQLRNLHLRVAGRILIAHWRRYTGVECKRSVMPKIAVYRFYWRDRQTGENVENPHFATLKAIKLHDGRNIEASRQIVDDNDIDEKGFLTNTKR
jgi:hypothetical protein